MPYDNFLQVEVDKVRIKKCECGGDIHGYPDGRGECAGCGKRMIGPPAPVKVPAARLMLVKPEETDNTQHEIKDPQ